MYICVCMYVRDYSLLVVIHNRKNYMPIITMTIRV